MSQTRAGQIGNSRKSGWRGKVGTIDNGERYVVTYRDGTGQRREYGFTNERETAETWAAQVVKNPMWKSPRIRDRRAA